MATQSSLQDCYFYFYSSCTKGDECPFRHCDLALGTETVCSLWREGRCFRSNCKFRHMESRINRTTIPCYWENQPGGCRKPHCVFLHRKLRNGVQDSPGLILPTSDSPKLLDLNDTCTAPNKVSLAEKVDEGDVPPDPSLTPVPPLVLSFDEGEESDTESVSSTPVKQGDKKAEKARNNLSVKASGGSEEKDFGIKTLEQIRMEKIHKESDSYYGAAYASTPLDASRLIDQHYPPTSEFLALPKDSLATDKSSPAPAVEPKLSGVDEETDLRGRLSNRRNAASNKVNPAKRLINFKKQNGNQVEGVSKLDFRIKTLDEIRREKESKQSKPEVVADSSSDGLPPSEENNLNNRRVKPLRKLKINRLSKAMSSLKQDVTATDLTENNTPADSASNALKKLSPKSSENSSESPVLNRNSSDSSPGKRKSENDACSTASKVIKFATVSSDGSEAISRVSASPDKREENLLQHPGTQSSSPADEANNTSPVHTPTSSTSVPDIEVNGVASSPSPCHISSTQTASPSGDETLNTSVSAGKDSLVDRSMSMDAELEELLDDDDMTIDEMDSAPNDDILLQIEEFLES